MFQNPTKMWFAINFCMIEWLLKVILGYLCQLYAHGGTHFSGPLRVFNDKKPCMGKAYLLMKTLEYDLWLWDQPFSLPLSLVNVIKHQFHHWWKMLTNIMCAKTFFNPYLLVEVRLHDDLNAKKSFNHIVLWKNISNLTNYAQTLKDFTNVVESQGPFWQPPSWWPQFIPTWIVGFDWNWCIDTYTHCSLHLGTSVFCAIMWTKLDFILTCP